MKNKNIIPVAGAIIVAGGLIIGGNILSSGSALPQGGGTNIHGGSVASNVNGATGGDEQLAPDFTLTNLKGEEITLSSYRGEKPVVLDFFATWCPNCQRDMPKLSKMYEKYSDQVEVIGINLQERQSLVEDFIEERGILFPIVMDPRGSASRDYGVRYTNYHILVGIDGNISGLVPGDISESDILSLI